MLNKSIKFLIENKLVAVLLLVLFIGWGTVNAPFNWDTGFLPSNPVAVDAIPDIGENQQIVFTKWDGRSPQDIEDQITYPLTTSLLGIPGVKPFVVPLCSDFQVSISFLKKMLSFIGVEVEFWKN